MLTVSENDAISRMPRHCPLPHEGAVSDPHVPSPGEEMAVALNTLRKPGLERHSSGNTRSPPDMIPTQATRRASRQVITRCFEPAAKRR